MEPACLFLGTANKTRIIKDKSIMDKIKDLVEYRSSISREIKTKVLLKDRDQLLLQPVFLSQNQLWIQKFWLKSKKFKAD